MDGHINQKEEYDNKGDDDANVYNIQMKHDCKEDNKDNNKEGKDESENGTKY